MDVKLTLRLNKQVVAKAKRYAAAKEQSLSRMVEAYFKSLTDESTGSKDDIEISTYVKSLNSGTSVPIDINEKQSYLDHLDKKYK